MNKTQLAESVRAEREKMGMTRSELADCIGVAGSTVWRWEHEQCMITLNHWQAIVELSAEFADRREHADKYGI